MEDEGFFNNHLFSSMEDDKKTRNNPFLPWKTLKKETKNIRLPWKMTTKIKNITEIRQLDTVRDELYCALQFTVRAAKHRRSADVQATVNEVEKVMRRYPELAVQSNNKVMLRMGVLSIHLNIALMPILFNI